MLKKIKEGFEEVKRFMDKKIQAVKDILTSRSSRAVAGIIIVGIGVGLGGGLIVSAYVPLPN